MLFERGGKVNDFIPLLIWLRANLEVLPDSYLIETLHEFLRDATRDSKNTLVSRVARMQHCVFSGRLEERNVDAVDVTFAEFEEAFRSETRTPQDLGPSAWTTSSHKVPQDWSRLLRKGNPSWPSPTPRSALPSLAGWMWLRNYQALHAGLEKFHWDLVENNNKTQ